MEAKYEKVKLFRNQMEIFLPEGFRDMPDYLAKRKYPSKHRPPVILMDKNNIANFTFQLTEAALAEHQIKKAVEEFAKSIKQVCRSAKVQEPLYGERNDGTKIAWFLYENMAADADIFNIIFLTPLKGKLMSGSFNCILEMRKEWEEAAMHCIFTIEQTKEE